MGVIPEVLLHRCGSHARDIDIPAIDEMPTWRVHGETSFVRLPVYDFHLCKSNSLLVARGSGNARDHHELDQLLCLECQFPAFGLLQPIF